MDNLVIVILLPHGKSARLAELDALLNLGQKDAEIVDEEPNEAVKAGAKTARADTR